MNIEQTEAAPKSLAALLAGTVDVVAGGYLQVLDLVAQGRRLRAFLLMQQFPGFAGLVLPRASMPIRTIEDIKGMKVGVSAPGSESNRILNYILLQHGMRPEDVSVVGLGPSVTSFRSLERGNVDVSLAQGVGISFLAKRHPDLQILFDTRTPASTRAALGAERVPESVLIAHENWLNSNRDTARRLSGAFTCALGWIQGHTPEQIRQALPDASRSSDIAADLEAISSSQRMLSVSGRMTREMHEAAVRISGAAKNPNLEHAYTNEFLAMK